MNKLNHIAFIMDGNGRWGNNKKKGRNYGHIKGVDTIKKIIKGSIKLKIPVVSFYVFSTENWRRPKTEINFLFKLIDTYFSKEIESVKNQGIKLNIIGETKKLSKHLQLILNKSTKLTKTNKKIIVNLAINYGSKNEILSAFKSTLAFSISKFLSRYIISEKTFDLLLTIWSLYIGLFENSLKTSLTL